MAQTFESSKPIPSDSPPLTRLYRILPKQFTIWEPNIQIREPMEAILIQTTTIISVLWDCSDPAHCSQAHLFCPRLCPLCCFFPFNFQCSGLVFLPLLNSLFILCIAKKEIRKCHSAPCGFDHTHSHSFEFWVGFHLTPSRQVPLL